MKMDVSGYMTVLVLLISKFLASMQAASTNVLQKTEANLHGFLFKGYKRDVHPGVSNKSKASPVTVTFDAQVIRIIEVNERQQYIKVYLWVNQYWINSMLSWDPDKFRGIDSVHVSPDLIWVPDIVLYDSTDGNGQYNGGLDIYKNKVQVDADGKHSWLNPVVFQKICKLDVSYFPFDDQECTLKFGSWAYDETKIITKEFANTSSSNSFYIPNGEWELLSINTKENLHKYQCCEHRFSDVTVTIRLRRQAKNHTLTLILPCALLSSLVVLGFILPPESGERIGLSITVLLSVTVFQQLTSQIMPPYDFPYLAQYYLVTIMQTAFSLVSSTLILNIYHRSNRRMPNWTKKLLLGWLAPVLFFQCSKHKETLNSNSIIDDEELGNGNTEKFHAIKISKNKVDNSYMNSVIKSLEERNKSLEEAGNNDKTEYTDKDLLGSTLRKKASKVKFFSKTKKSSTASAIRNAIHQTAFPLLNEKASEGIEEYELLRQQEILKKRRAKDWLKAARVLDRFFFILYVIVSTTTLLAIFLRAPRFSQ